jgi:hypothetical protein
MASQYFIQREDQETGPFGFRELVAFVRDGKLVHSDRVRFSWTNDWQRADSLVGLFHMAQKSPEELSRHDVPPVTPVADEPIPVPLDEQFAIPEVQDRPGWVMRLMNIGGFRKTKSVEIPILGPPSDATAACASTSEDSTLQAPQVGGCEPASLPATARVPQDEQPAEIAAFFNQDAAGRSNLWSSTVEEALASVKARGAGKSAKSRTGRIGKMFGVLSRIIPHGEGGAVMRNGFRIVCAIVCANLAAWAVESWSAQEALRFPSREAQRAALRHFPMLGTCGSGEYLFLMFFAGIAAWFAARWLESRAE